MSAGHRASQLEAGEVVRAGPTAFALTDIEAMRVTDGVATGGSKNISFDPSAGILRGAAAAASDDQTIVGLMRRYSEWASALIVDSAPEYAPHLRMGRTSLRTRDAGAPAISPRKDDRRLHADAFTSRPTAGARILRVFSNINPAGQARIWQVGEAFEDYARRWADRIRRPLTGEAWLLERIGLTRGRRTPYDALMLGLHDRGKLDESYQRTGPRRVVSFAAGESWLVFTDSVIHAAVSGRFALEQTFYLPVEGMVNPSISPLRVLERITGRRLV